MQIGQAIQSVTINRVQFTMRRTPEGVMEMWGEDDIALASAMGFAHALDRMLQMMLVRLAGQGRLSECLRSDEGNFAFDRFARELRFAADAQEDVANLSDEARCLAENYCHGLNNYLENYGYPWELRLVGFRPEPWTVADSLLTSKLLSYIPFAESQQAMEKFLIQSIKSGVAPERLRKLFRPYLDGLTEEIVRLIKKTAVLPLSAAQPGWIPSIRASNNWVVSGSRTESGLPLECHDPHLEVNRLPALWYEFIQHTQDNFRIGVTIPGIPCMIMGRTRDVSYGFTFGFMDMVDYFIEEVREGRCRVGAEYEDFTVRTEVIRRKRKPPITLKLWENRHGVLEVPKSTDALEDGLYLCRAWSAERQATAQSFNALSKAVDAKTVFELQEILVEVTSSCNWLMADKQGNIGFQQSGRLPLRQHSGLHPVPGWDENYEWKGYASGDQLARISNPPEGYLATANNDLNQEGKPLSINLPQGPYRSERICQLLEGMHSCTVEHMKMIQQDRYSLQAERFMEMLRPLLPEKPPGRLLKEWDCRYSKESRSAYLFEEIYSDLLEKVFGVGLFGAEAWRDIVAETGILTDFYHIFDNALLGNDLSWFGAAGREATLRAVVERVLSRFPDPESVPCWGNQRQVMMTHVFFGGKLPRFAGFDYGPITIEGNRATVVQGAIYKYMGRTTTLAPSYRFVTDLADTRVLTALAGGPSDRRFSKYYATDISRWQNYDYKLLCEGK